MSQTSSTTTRPTFILVDGHSLAFRSYFAFAKGRDGGLRTKTGIPTSVCFGFIKSLLEVMTTQQPQAMAIAFDLGLPTFRHEADDTYKADRPGTPEDFVPDLKNLHELLAGFNLPIFTAPGYEADDVLGTLAQLATAAGYKVKILTGDRDLFQLIDLEKQITVLNFSPDAWKRSTNGITEFGPEQVQEKLGVLPTQIVDFKALCGDKSDNIPGVKGIGEKTAVQLLSTYGSLEKIYAALDEIKGATHKKLVEGQEDAQKSHYLAKIVIDVPLEVNLEDCKLTGFDQNVLVPILEKLEFNRFLKQINELQQKFGGQVVKVAEISTPTTQIKSNDEDDSDLWFFSAADTAAAKQKPDSAIQTRIIDSEAKLSELVNLLQQFTNPETPVAWDTETTDLEPRDAALVGIGCCWGSNQDDMAYIPVGHKTGNNLNLDKVLSALRPILESVDYPKALQNAKFDRLVMRCQGIKLAGVVFDTMLASYLLNPDGSHNLSDLAYRYLGLTAKSYVDLVPKGKNIADLDIPTVADYCGMDVYSTFVLVPKLREELEQLPNLYQLLLEVEQPLEAVLAEMEYTGIRIDSAYLKELSQQLETDLAKLEATATEIAGEKFNLGSPKQLSHILFEKLGLSTKYSRKIQTGYSTDAATLEKLQEIDKTGFVDALIEYRTLSKLKSTYVDALPALVSEKTQRVHTDFNQAATSTGRLSSSNPNLQNIPIRTAFSRRIRKAFLPEPGWLMVAADYSQIELRILAHLSQEPVLVQAYQQNEDIHTVTARLVFEKEDVTSDERRLAKTINFGVIYGMGSLKFARSTGVDKANASEFIKRFNERYAQVFAYLERVKKEAIAQGYVETILGRRRYVEFTSNNLRKLKGSNPEDIDLSKLKNLGAYDAGLLRSAANAPIQGSSADIIKIAMVKLHEILSKYQARLLLQVHDELVFEVPPQEWAELQPQIKSAMEGAVNLSVPLLVDVRAGDNWMETK
ncbi:MULTISPECIES: DNA polymerase I [unclassified Tolypothrix]|uniref:DNA polymerase I n=1 Tax=unclassified Tolypothrix TaxID=2649714 RepID=UPI0005EAA3E3|nr:MULTISPECIES: DNA polymerase I [unclassified Tolypothrix]BAY94082.1 DNA polymerase I [Microchaete diplosiphon NIES-3275]EKF03717.1 DNA-directed DNA polymerase I [Tolypothrix sp. PCC 7601]MBE9084290.1 DNA polymerase I [Tolypothrix sp. LEGE 11397]UYD27845.1 DNA polymerase I [Tolypothrix sp. PCC 7712]UYD36290.1 DNA polymerase I [Tolypothrix sp. PCC 7601]